MLVFTSVSWSWSRCSRSTRSNSELKLMTRGNSTPAASKVATRPKAAIGSPSHSRRSSCSERAGGSLKSPP